MIGSVHKAGNTGNIDEVTHVGAIGHTPNRGSMPGNGAMRRAYLGHQRVLGSDFGRGELSTEPLDARWMLSQPGIACGSLHDSRHEFGPEAFERLAWNQSGAPLGD